MSPSEFREQFSLESKSRSIASRHFAPTWEEVLRYFQAIEKEVRMARGMAAHLSVVREYVEQYERVTSFFQFSGSNLGNLTAHERSCLETVVARLTESSEIWAEVHQRMQTE